MQEITVLSIASGRSQETELKAALSRLNKKGRRVLSIAYANYEFILLHEPLPSAPMEETTPAEHAAIRARPDILTLSPGETAQVLVLFEHITPCELRYKVLDEGGGTINEEGVYTAPPHSGVFEISVECPSHPQLGTKVYAAVK
ncbi:hypothetical protein LJC49_03335 [Ruminococcaceae bacterium OttesenSCG-928-I18]|nr:hypothetical protein [Ruminococcaceae bacterium OttesenSCG-928-I18]